MEWLTLAVEFLKANSGTIVIVLGVVFGIAKAFSNEKAGPVIGFLQRAVDLLPKGIGLVGQLVAIVCEILAQALKSDGLFGRK